MSIRNRLSIIAAAALCLACASCSKSDKNPYGNSIWTGEYPTQTQNGTTGEIEDHTGSICLYFQKDGEECTVETGIVDLYAVNRTTYEARWSDMHHFSLYSAAGGQELHCYSGEIGGGKLMLQALNCDGVAATYELHRLLPE